MAFDTRKISEFALHMRNPDPREYERFLRILDEYTHELTVAVTEAGVGDVLVAQGRAQQARKFLQLFSEAREPKPKPTP